MYINEYGNSRNTLTVLLLRDRLARKNSVGTFKKRNCYGIPINKLFTITLQWLRSEFIIKVERRLKTVKKKYRKNVVSIIITLNYIHKKKKKMIKIN